MAVIAEPGRPRATAGLLGAAARIATDLAGQVTLFTTSGGAEAQAAAAWARGADTVLVIGAAGEPRPGRKEPASGGHGSTEPAAEDVAAAVAAWAQPLPGRDGEQGPRPWAILAPSSSWGREVAGRVSAALGAGLTGDAVGLEVAGGRLFIWKPAFGGQLVAAVTARSARSQTTRRGERALRREISITTVRQIWL